MALIKCPECNKDVSSKAVSCPNCGYPLEAAPPAPAKQEFPKEIRLPEVRPESIEPPAEEPSNKKLSIVQIFFIIVIIGFVIFGAIRSLMPPEPERTDIEARIRASMPKVTNNNERYALEKVLCDTMKEGLTPPGLPPMVESVRIPSSRDVVITVNKKWNLLSDIEKDTIEEIIYFTVDVFKKELQLSGTALIQDEKNNIKQHIVVA